MVARAVKALLKKTASGKLCKSNGFAAFRAINENGRAEGPRLRGVAASIHKKLWNPAGVLPACAKEADVRPGNTWRGKGGGQKRGKAVDSQIARLTSMSSEKRKSARMLRLTRMTFASLDMYGLKPVMAQRVVIDTKRGLGTACDMICSRGKDELVVVELKSGYAGSRTAPSTSWTGTDVRDVCKMLPPLHKANDCVLHRHLAQLTATWKLFCNEKTTQKLLSDKGVKTVSAALVYVCDSNSELHELPGWWQRRATKILDAL